MGIVDEELEALAVKVAEFVRRGLGNRSRWALRAALDAAEVDGITGVLAFKICSKQADQHDVMFSVGTVDVVQRWGS